LHGKDARHHGRAVPELGIPCSCLEGIKSIEQINHDTDSTTTTKKKKKKKKKGRDLISSVFSKFHFLFPLHQQRMGKPSRSLLR
jgi:hypothetical protein